MALAEQTLPDLDPRRIADGLDFVDVCPMVTESNDGSAILASAGEEPEFYDILLRPDNFDDNQGDSYAEWDDLTFDQANEKVAELQARYPGINVNWIEPS